MRLSWYGTAAVMIESSGCRIVFDPFMGMPFQEDPALRAQRAAELRQADAVLVTHGHFDHIYDIPQLYADGSVPVYATAVPCSTLRKLGVAAGRLHCVSPGDVLTIGPFTVAVYQGRHCRFDAAVVRQTIFRKATLRHPLRLLHLLSLNRPYPESGETLLYEIRAEGRRVQLTGSMGLHAGIDYPTGADVLVLPFQGTGNPAATAAPIVDALRPRSVYLDHYDNTFPPLSAQISTGDFVRMMGERGIPCEPLRVQEHYEI